MALADASLDVLERSLRGLREDEQVQVAWRWFASLESDNPTFAAAILKTLLETLRPVKWAATLLSPDKSDAPPVEKAAAAAQSAVNAGFKAFEVVQGRPYTPLKSKAVEDAVKPIATSAINIYKATESAAKAAPTFTPKLTKTLEKAYKDAPSVSAKLGQQAQTALSRKAQETQRAAQEAAKRAAARGGPYAQQLQARATQAAAKQTELLRKQAAEQAKAAAAVASKQPAFQQVSRTYSKAAPVITKAYATTAPIIKNTAVKYAAVPAGEALRKASQELQKTKSYKTFAAKPEAAIGVGTFLLATVIALAAPKPAKIVAPPPPPEPVVVAAPSLDLTKVKLPDVDVSGTLESIKRIDVSKVKVPDVSTIDVSKASAQLGDAAKKTSEDASKALSKAAADAGPAIGAFTTDVAVPALKYGADEPSKAASAAASQVAVVRRSPRCQWIVFRTDYASRRSGLRRTRPIGSLWCSCGRRCSGRRPSFRSRST